jgi:hypothetical protein
MATAVVSYRDENGNSASATKQFATLAEAQSYAADVVDKGFSAPGGASDESKFYPAKAVDVVDVNG